MFTKKRFFAFLLMVTLIASIPTTAFALDIPGRGKGEIERMPFDLWGEELPAVLDCYRQILEPIREKAEKTWYEDFCYGVLEDVDGDGYPELLLLYSPNGNDLEAVIACRTGKGRVEGYKHHICTLAGGAGGGLAVGKYKDMTVVHVIYQNSTKGGTCRIGWDDVFNIAGGIAVYTSAGWSEDESGVNQYEVNGRSAAAEYQSIMNGITVRYGGPGHDGAKTLSDLAKDIESYNSSAPSGHTVCWRCSGTGRCSYCYGTGRWLNDGLEWQSCPFCVYGQCSFCFGRGYVD